MLAVLEEPAIRARVIPMSVEHYHRMSELGMIADRTELIRGALVEKMSQSPLHASIVEILRDHVTEAVPAGWIVRQEKPLTLADSEPEPDILAVRGSRTEFLHRHPSTAAFIVEVCVTSEAVDRVKLEVYAEAGVPECWLVLAEERMVERHTEPADGRYGKVERASFPATLESTVLPGLVLPPREVFPG